MRIGTKELKNRLSHYLELARAGEAIQVTSRGKVVVELRAVKPVVPRVVAGSPRLISAIVLEDRGGHVCSHARDRSALKVRRSVNPAVFACEG